MLNKEARLCNSLVGIKSVLMELGVEDIKNEVTKNGETETINCFNEIEKFIIEYITNSIQSYKFEELTPNMWVWDDKLKWLYHIFAIREEDKIVEVIVSDRNAIFRKVVTLGKFEENRFYPLVKAMYREE